MKIQLKRSSVLDNGAAKQPTAEQLEYGELAVNYNATDPTIFIKSSDNSIVQIAGANALTKVPGLEEVLTAGNLSSSKDILVGGSGAAPNLEITTAGNVRAITAYVTGASTLAGKVTANAGMDVTGTVDINNSLNVTEGTALTGAVTMGATLGVTGVLTATTYNLGALAALPA